MVDEPTAEDAISILRGLKDRYENHHQVRIKDEAIVAAVELSQRYITSRFLPDKAIDLIDEAASKLRLEMNSVPEEIDVLDRRVRQLEIEREAIRRENDKERVEQLTHEIEELGAKRAELRAKWEGERDVLKKIQENKDRIEQLKIEAQQAERQGDYGKVAEIRYGKIQEAEKEIAGTEIQLMRMGEPGVPTVEEYCGKVLPENGVLGLCGLTASCGLVRGVQKKLDAKKGTIKTLNLEDELWTEGRPALPATPAWILPKEYAGFSPAEKLERLRGKLKELGCTAQLVGKLDNLAWLLNLRAMDIQCTPYAMSYCYVTPERAVLFINTARLGAEAAAELKANGVEIQEYDDVLKFLAAETEPQTVLADPASVNFAVYETLQNNAALTVKDEADPLLPMKGVKNEVELAHDREAHLRDAVAMVRFQKELEERLAAGEELTELTVDEILHKYRSAQDKFIVESFGTIAAYGGNAAMMHYHATEEDHAKLERKGFLLVDSGATYLDGTTDITRTYPLGELTEDEKLFYTWTLQCHIDIAKAVWLNYCDGHMLDTIAREPLWQHLINYRCGTGHSVSFVGNVHEGPHALNGRNTTVFQPGMIITDEPGVYEAGQVGIRIENELECYHKADNQYGTFLAFRPLTFVPIATSPVVPGVLTRDELDWLNAYHREVFEKLAPRLNEEERDWLAKKCAAIGA